MSKGFTAGLTAGLRVLELLYAAIVIGLSITAVKWQHFGSVPATNGYAVFAGAFGAFAGVLGLAAIWMPPLGRKVMFVVDGLATIFFLAGGLALAIGLHGVDCNHPKEPKTWHNKLISGGCIPLDGNPKFNWWCGYQADRGSDWAINDHNVEQRCRTAEADTAFMFLGFAVSLMAAILNLIMMRKEKGRSAARS